MSCQIIFIKLYVCVFILTASKNILWTQSERTFVLDDQITENDIKLTRETWAEIEKDFEGTGLVLFQELFKDFPDYIKLFSRLKSPGDEDLFKSPRFRKHMISALLPSISEMLKNLDNEAALREQLLTIGKNHRKRKLTRQSFENIKGVIIKTLEIRLGDSFPAGAKEAWNRVLTEGFKIIYLTLESDEL